MTHTTPLLSSHQRAILEQIERANIHFFITGKAGTGKSTLLQALKKHTQKNAAVVAPTGVAALVAGGQTMHSFFRLPPTLLDQPRYPLDGRTKKMLAALQLLIIDEISMVRADLMDAIDRVLCQAKRSPLPFGGVQVVCFGDPYQLPPIAREHEHRTYLTATYGGNYFFQAEVWQKTAFRTLELTEVFRQSDQSLIELLNAIRTNQISSEQLAYLNRRVGLSDEDERVVTLTTTNRRADQINQYFLSQIAGTSVQFQAQVTGQLEPSSYPAEALLTLKPGAHVMMLKNDSERRWVNGSIGRVVRVEKSAVRVLIDQIEHEVKPEKWDKIRFAFNHETGKIEEQIVSTFTQIPMRLAWAVTIHKSQGQTFDRVNIDLERGAFAHGQTYVALSRCRTLSGMSLVRPVTQQDLIVDPAVITFMQRSA